MLVSRRWNDTLVHHTWTVQMSHVSAGRKFSGKTLVGAGQERRTPRSQSRVLISPLNDGVLSNHRVCGERPPNNVIRIDEIVGVAC